MLFWITIVVVGVWFTWVLWQMPLTWRTGKLITVWSATAGAGTAVVVAVAFAFAGAPIGLSVLTGLPVGGLVLAFSITLTDRRLDFPRDSHTKSGKRRGNRDQRVGGKPFTISPLQPLWDSRCLDIQGRSPSVRLRTGPCGPEQGRGRLRAVRPVRAAAPLMHDWAEYLAGKGR